MGERPEEQPEISSEQLTLFRRCQFVHWVFHPYPSIQSIQPINEEGWYASAPFRGEDYDPEKHEVVEEGWDHEHCYVCSVRIEDGDGYWANDGEGHVDLCEACYPRVMTLLEKQ